MNNIKNILDSELSSKLSLTVYSKLSFSLSSEINSEGFSEIGQGFRLELRPEINQMINNG